MIFFQDSVFDLQWFQSPSVTVFFSIQRAFQHLFSYICVNSMFSQDADLDQGLGSVCVMVLV